MLAHNVAWQGSALRALSLARPLARRGHDVVVVASRREPGTATVSDDVDGVRLLQLPDLAPARLRNGGLSPIDLLGRLRLVRKLDADVVHAFEPRPTATLPALALRRRTGARYVADWADLWGAQGMAATWPLLERATLGRLDDALQRRTRATADAVTAISASLATHARELGVPDDRVRLLTIGANADTFHPGRGPCGSTDASGSLLTLRRSCTPASRRSTTTCWRRRGATSPGLSPARGC